MTISTKCLLLGFAMLGFVGCDKGKISLDDIRAQATNDFKKECSDFNDYQYLFSPKIIDADTLYNEFDIGKNDKDIIGGCLIKATPPISLSKIDFKKICEKNGGGIDSLGEFFNRSSPKKSATVFVIKSKKDGELIDFERIGLLGLLALNGGGDSKNSQVITNDDYVMIRKLHSAKYEKGNFTSISGTEKEICNKLYIYSIEKRESLE